MYICINICIYVLTYVSTYCYTSIFSTKINKKTKYGRKLCIIVTHVTQPHRWGNLFFTIGSRINNYIDIYIHNHNNKILRTPRSHYDYNNEHFNSFGYSIDIYISFLCSQIAQDEKIVEGIYFYDWVVYK